MSEFLFYALISSAATTCWLGFRGKANNGAFGVLTAWIVLVLADALVKAIKP